MSIARRLFSYLRRGLRALLRPRPVVLPNVNRVDETTRPRRALLIYITKPFLIDEAHPDFLKHQNLRQSRQIAGILDGLGFVVDVTDTSNPVRAARRDHELVISNNCDWAGATAEGAVRLFLATNLCHPISNAAIRRRHAALSARGRADVRVRRIFSEVMPFVERAHAIAAFGDEHTAGSWRSVFRGPIHRFDNYGFRETPLVAGKDLASARAHFLFFASGSQVQKGLDLLLEIFPRHPDLVLHVCSGFRREEDFCDAYRRELFETPNVRAEGWVEVNGPEFLELARTCACVIHPTCSDGQAGSVVQCMHAGLIPIVTREAGIEVEDFGVLLEDDSIEAIERVIVETAGRPAEWHRERSLRTRAAAMKTHSEERFVERWREIFEDVLRRGT